MLTGKESEREEEEEEEEYSWGPCSQGVYYLEINEELDNGWLDRETHRFWQGKKVTGMCSQALDLSVDKTQETRVKCGGKGEITLQGRDWPTIPNGLASSLVGQPALGATEVARIADHVFWPKLFNWNWTKSLELSLGYRK